jgi:hypothetical protein
VTEAGRAAHTGEPSPLRSAPLPCGTLGGPVDRRKADGRAGPPVPATGGLYDHAGIGTLPCTQERLEDYLTRSGRELQRIAMQDYLDADARREERLAVVTGADLVARRRAEPGHTRQLLTTVGPVEVSRIAYRAPKAANLHPVDAVLALPARLHSAPLQRAVVHEVADGPLRSAREALARATGQHLGTRQLQEIAIEAARDVRDFYDQRAESAGEPPAAAGARGRHLLVLSIDATGVLFVQPDRQDLQSKVNMAEQMDGCPQPPDHTRPKQTKRVS